VDGQSLAQQLFTLEYPYPLIVCDKCSIGKGDLVSIEISHETETRLAAEARRLGVSVDAFLSRLISEHAALTKAAQSAAALPVWHLGGAGALHRRDIYDDVG
jgi:hypothetical protein